MLLQIVKFYFFLVLIVIQCVCVCVCVCVPHLCSSLEGHLGCFHILAVVNNAAINIGMCVSFQANVFIFFRCVPRSGIAGSYGVIQDFFDVDHF